MGILCLFAENPQIPALLYSWQGGMEGGAAIADILYGDVCPSGKLVDTITKGYEYYPCVEDFHDHAAAFRRCIGSIVDRTEYYLISTA